MGRGGMREIQGIGGRLVMLLEIGLQGVRE